MVVHAGDGEPLPQGFRSMGNAGPGAPNPQARKDAADVEPIGAAATTPVDPAV